MSDFVDEDNGYSSPYHPSSDAGTPNQSMRHIRCRSTGNPSISSKRPKIDGEVEDQTEDDLMLRSSSQTGSKKLQQFYGLGLDDSQLDSYPYYQNMKAFNAPDDDSGDNEFEVIELQRGPNGYGYDLKSNSDSDEMRGEYHSVGMPRLSLNPKRWTTKGLWIKYWLKIDPSQLRSLNYELKIGFCWISYRGQEISSQT
ncbi:hypothetical protein C8R42DRAFT_641975 [Lentinula raphanica]|nr:hypothetical protein C8R42DRAFT_641975 [Lentinula raphanica]